MENKKERNNKIAGAVLGSFLLGVYLVVTENRISELESSESNNRYRLLDLENNLSNLKTKFDSEFDVFSGEQTIKNKESNSKLVELELKLIEIEGKLKRQ